MKKIIIGLLVVLSTISISYAQDYRTGIGVRGGYFNGLTIKHFTSQSTAFEFLLASRWRGFEITGLYEFHKPAFQEER